MLDKVKAFDENRASLEEMVELSAMARLLESEFKETGAEAPEYLSAQAKSIRRAINSRTRDLIEKQISEAESRLESLKTAEQKRQDLAAQISALKAKLG